MQHAGSFVLQYLLPFPVMHMPCTSVTVAHGCSTRPKPQPPSSPSNCISSTARPGCTTPQLCTRSSTQTYQCTVKQGGTGERGSAPERMIQLVTCKLGVGNHETEFGPSSVEHILSCHRPPTSLVTVANRSLMADEPSMKPPLAFCSALITLAVPICLLKGLIEVNLLPQ